VSEPYNALFSAGMVAFIAAQFVGMLVAVEVGRWLWPD
jgi:hypothetical protein